MSAPTQVKDWTISANNRIVYPLASLTPIVDIMGAYLRGVADFLLANGYTCKGSSDGTTAAMDGVYRWLTDADAETRGGSTVAAQSWVVLTDGNGCDICIAYEGTNDGYARFSYSPSGAYVAAGTATFTPTAGDELIMMTGQSVFDLTTSLDRLWFGWVDSNAQMCRFCVLRDGVLVGVIWGVELVDAFLTTVSYSPEVWGFGYITSSFYFNASSFYAGYAANNRGGLAYINGNLTQIAGGVFLNQQGLFSGGKPELYRGIGGMNAVCFIGSRYAGSQGPIGKLIDWYGGPANPSGDTLNLVQGDDWVTIYYSVSPTTPLMWPWDRTILPETA